MGGKSVAAIAAVLTTVTVLSGCGESAAASAAAEYAETLRERIAIDAMMVHLVRLQQIADAHGGNRALGTPGYDASVDYVVRALQDSGFDVQTPEFDVLLPFADDPVLTVDGMTIPAQPLKFTLGTPPEGVSGPLVAAPAGRTPGCSAADYDGLTVAGAVVLVDRGACRFDVKRAAAAELGAVALIVANDVDEGDPAGTLDAQTDSGLPVVSVSKADGVQLRGNPGQVTVELNAGIRVEKSRNIIAQTRTGSTSDVVMAGAHLDSVPWAPGTNDNGSGVAAVLETALQLGGSPNVKNAVRFGFWGAEEVGLMGSRAYVDSLDAERLNDIALYLNFDILASPNPGYFVYNGDPSAESGPDGPASSKAEGSAGIERVLSEYLTSAGKPPEDLDFAGRSDDAPFSMAGVPTGGVFSGADTEMSDEQARLWGGTPGELFDPNYHQSTDTLAHVDRRAMHINGGAVAYAVGLFAQHLAGRNGVPGRVDRIRHTRPCSATGEQQAPGCGCGVEVRNGVPSWTCAPSL